MGVTVAIPGIWRGLTGGAAAVECDGATVLAVLQDLVARHPLMYDRLFTPAGEAKGFVYIFLNKQVIEGLTTPVAPGDQLRLLMAIAGGAY